MCIICVQLEQGKLSLYEAQRNLGELTEQLGDHVSEVKTLIQEKAQEEDGLLVLPISRGEKKRYISFFWEQVEERLLQMSPTARWLLTEERLAAYAAGTEALPPLSALSLPMGEDLRFVQGFLRPVSGKLDDLVAWANIQVSGKHEVELHLEEDGAEAYDMAEMFVDAGWINPYGSDTSTCLRRPGLVTDVHLNSGPVVASGVETGYVNDSVTRSTLLRTQVTTRCLCCETLSHAAATAGVNMCLDLTERVEIQSFDKHPCKDACCKGVD